MNPNPLQLDNPEAAGNGLDGKGLDQPMGKRVQRGEGRPSSRPQHREAGRRLGPCSWTVATSCPASRKILAIA